MRFAVLSDIHGNLPALEAVLKVLSQQNMDGFILAGDYTGCPQAAETIDLLRELKGWMIQGNGEANLARLARSDALVAWKTTRWEQAGQSFNW